MGGPDPAGDTGPEEADGGWFSTADAGRQLRLVSAPVRCLLELVPEGPAGNFSEYYTDMDRIIDDQLWTPGDLEGARGLFAWGPPPPPPSCVPRTSRP